MTETNDPINAKPLRFRRAFGQRLPQIRNVAEAEYVPITVDTVSVVTMVLGVWANICSYRDEIVKELPGFDIALFDGLESVAMALGHAQTEYQTANEPPPSLVELGAKVLKSRGILFNDLGTQVARELLPESVLKEVKGGTGYKSYAFDVFAMSNVYRRNWDKVSAFTSFRPGELDEAEALADALTTAVSLVLSLLGRDPDPAKSRKHVLLSVLVQPPTNALLARLHDTR